MKTFLFVALTLSVAAGCSSSYDVSKEPAPDKYSFAQINENAAGHPVTIRTMQGDEISATELSVGADSTVFVQAAAGSSTTIATSSVQRITINRVGAGAVDGIIWGAIVGVPIGVFLGGVAAALEDNNESMDPAVAAGTVGITAAVGAGIGALIGHSDKYIFQPEEEK